MEPPSFGQKGSEKILSAPWNPEDRKPGPDETIETPIDKIPNLCHQKLFWLCEIGSGSTV